MDIEQVVQDIIWYGPDRVLVNPDCAVDPKRARNDYNVEPDIIFIRNDGWSLAAPSFLERDAFGLWENEWTHFMRRPEKEAKPISEY